MFPLIFSKVKMLVESSTHDHFLFYDHFPSINDFNISVNRINRFLLEIKERSIIKYIRLELKTTISYSQ